MRAYALPVIVSQSDAPDGFALGLYRANVTPETSNWPWLVVLPVFGGKALKLKVGCVLPGHGPSNIIPRIVSGPCRYQSTIFPSACSLSTPNRPPVTLTGAAV